MELSFSRRSQRTGPSSPDFRRLLATACRADATVNVVGALHQVVVQDEVMSSGGNNLYERLLKEFNEFPVRAGWYQPVQFGEPTTKAPPQGLDKTKPVPEWADAVAIPSYARYGNVLEVIVVA